MSEPLRRAGQHTFGPSERQSLLALLPSRATRPYVVSHSMSCICYNDTIHMTEILTLFDQHMADANPDWPAHVRITIADLGKRLGHGI